MLLGAKVFVDDVSKWLAIAICVAVIVLLLTGARWMIDSARRSGNDDDEEMDDIGP